jgi:hypothetical protein
MSDNKIRLTNGNDFYEHTPGSKWTDILGLDGDDHLKSNRNGSLIGGKGNDILESTTENGWGGHIGYWDSPSSVYVDLAAGYALDGWGTRDKLINITEVGNSGRDGDVILGDHLNNHFGVNGFWQSGSALIDGRDGNDIVKFWGKKLEDFEYWVSADGKSFSFTLNNYKVNFKNIESIEFNDQNSNNRIQVTDLIDKSSIGNQLLISSESHRWKLSDFGPDKTLSYSFMLAQPGYAASQGLTGFKPATDAYKKAVRDIFSQLSKEINVRFIEVDENATQVGQLRFGSSQQAATKGVAFVPGTVNDSSAGDVFMDVDSVDLMSPGLEGFQTLLHEIGHALGLSHPLMAADSSNRATLLPKWNDPVYTVMINGPSLTGLWQSGFGSFDLQALKHLYGASQANPAPSNDSFAIHDSHGQVIFTLQDTGGYDTLDLSDLSLGAMIDLKPGSTSSVGFNSKNSASQDNMLIAQNTWIEKIIGTRFDDVLKGTDQANVFYPTKGNDLIDGRGGLDRVYFNASRKEYDIYFSNWANNWSAASSSGESGSNTFLNIERLHFNDLSTALDLNGNAGVVAKILGAVFGPSYVSNREFVGIGLLYTDVLNFNSEDLTALAINARLGSNPSSRQVVDLLYTNVVGQRPDNQAAQFYVDMLDSGSKSVKDLGWMAANTSFNEVNINLTGLLTTGLDYQAIA